MRKSAELSISTSVNEIGVALDLVAPTLLSSTRPLTLVHLLEELYSKASGLCNTHSTDPQLQACMSKLTKLRKAYLLDIGVDADRDSAMVNASANDALPPGSPIKHGPAGVPAKPEEGNDGDGSAVPDRTSSKDDDSVPWADDEEGLRTVSAYIAKREYIAAERAIQIVLKDRLQLNLELTSSDNSGASLRQMGRTWAQELRESGSRKESRIQLAIRTLRRYHLLELYRAVVARLVGNGTENGLLNHAESIYTVCAEVMRYVRDVNFLQDQNSLIRASLGIVLSRLNRHREAQRRYNEAYGYLSYVQGPLRPIRWATIDLSRAETFLLRAGVFSGTLVRIRFRTALWTCVRCSIRRGEGRIQMRRHPGQRAMVLLAT